MEEIDDAIRVAIDEAITAGACHVAEREDRASAAVWRAVGNVHSRRAVEALATFGPGVQPRSVVR